MILKKRSFICILVFLSISLFLSFQTLHAQKLEFENNLSGINNGFVLSPKTLQSVVSINTTHFKLNYKINFNPNIREDIVDASFISINLINPNDNKKDSTFMQNFIIRIKYSNQMNDKRLESGNIEIVSNNKAPLLSVDFNELALIQDSASGIVVDIFYYYQQLEIILTNPDTKLSIRRKIAVNIPSEIKSVDGMIALSTKNDEIEKCIYKVKFESEPTQYSVIELEEYPPYENIKITNLNNKGTVIGYAETPENYKLGLKWSILNGWSELTPVQPKTSVVPYSINSSGSIVGQNQNYAYYCQNNKVKFLKHLGAWQSSEACALQINDNGKSVGTSNDNAALWDLKTGFVTNVNPEDESGNQTSNSKAIAINNNDTILINAAGYSFLFYQGKMISLTKWDSNGQYTPDSMEKPIALDDSDRVLGTKPGVSEQTNGTWYNSSIIREPNGNQIKIGPISEKTPLLPTDMNNNQQVVGKVNYPCQDCPPRDEWGFYWDPKTNIKSLIEMLDDTGKKYWKKLIRDIVKLRVQGKIFSGDMLHSIYKFNAG